MANTSMMAQHAAVALTAGADAANNPLARPKQEFDRLVQRYHKQAYNIAYRLTGNNADAEDLVQEAFLRAFRFFGHYRRDLPFENWLYRIMSNLFVDELRRRPKAKIYSLDNPVTGGDLSGDNNAYLEIPDSRENPERVVLHEELDEQIQKALATLPPDFRMTVILADIEGMSYEEISETMRCSLGTVRSRLHRGRKMLRGKLAGFSLK
jgi:RNA polymerase sigma-70 factor (ECF subfamily)